MSASVSFDLRDTTYLTKAAAMVMTRIFIACMLTIEKVSLKLCSGELSTPNGNIPDVRLLVREAL